MVDKSSYERLQPPPPLKIFVRSAYVVRYMQSTSGADSAGGGGGAQGHVPPPPAVTPSMGIYKLFYNALFTF